MNRIFHPVSEQEALARAADLPLTLARLTRVRLRGPEGRNQRAQGKTSQGWHQLFVTLNRRTCP
jgi:hypothetical protein